MPPDYSELQWEDICGHWKMVVGPEEESQPRKLLGRTEHKWKFNLARAPWWGGGGGGLL